jgi:hypothetical protein
MVETCSSGKQEVLGRSNRLVSMTREGVRMENSWSTIVFISACVIVAVVTFLPSHYLATRRDAHIDTHRLMEQIYYARRCFNHLPCYTYQVS